MHRVERRRRKEVHEHQRKRRRMWLAALGLVPAMLAAFIWLVTMCSTGRYGNSVSPNQLGDLLLDAVAQTSFASGAGLALVALSVLKLVTAWWGILTRK